MLRIVINKVNFACTITVLACLRHTSRFILYYTNKILVYSKYILILRTTNTHKEHI